MNLRASCVLLLVAGGLICYSKFTTAIYCSVGFGIVGFMATGAIIPRVREVFIRVGLYGKDLNKPGRPVLAESMGAVAAGVYLFVMFLSIPFVFYKYLVVTSGGGTREVEVGGGPGSEWVFPHGKLSAYLSGVLCIQSIIFLGVTDDLFDLRWRHKMFIPVISSIPLLVVYYADFGATYVAVPGFVGRVLPALGRAGLIDLGWLYYVYMASFSVFCTNSINILAGVNGLEVLQAIVLAVICLANDALYLVWGSRNSKESHLFSMVMIIPFLGVSVALWRWNRWPARVFVGDTYCYFAGMVFAVVGILGHFSKTMLLFFIPQLCNFAYSVPQLLGVVHCPRHRLPRFDERTGLLYPSSAALDKRPPMRAVACVLKLMSYVKLVEVTLDAEGRVVDCSNLTLINLVLVWLGPMREDRLCLTICGVQLVVGFLAIAVRHALGALIFGHDNLWHAL